MRRLLSSDVVRETFGAVHDALDEEEERAEAHLQQQLVAVAQADGQGKVPLHDTLLGALETAQRQGEPSVSAERERRRTGSSPRRGTGAVFWGRYVRFL